MSNHINCWKIIPLSTRALNAIQSKWELLLIPLPSITGGNCCNEIFGSVAALAILRISDSGLSCFLAQAGFSSYIWCFIRSSRGRCISEGEWNIFSDSLVFICRFCCDTCRIFSFRHRYGWCQTLGSINSKQHFRGLFHTLSCYLRWCTGWHAGLTWCRTKSAIN